uniref:Uncharacterized protein n=1 Tax=Periophthalmus magnuspinnatus TaxID=409849 RepID=A0A3B3ZUD0_9GOBI
MISQVQQERMEDQRCELKVTPKPYHSEAFFNQLATSQSHRLDDQRVSLPSLPGIQNGEKNNNAKMWTLNKPLQTIQVPGSLTLDHHLQTSGCPVIHHRAHKTTPCLWLSLRL